MKTKAWIKKGLICLLLCMGIGYYLETAKKSISVGTAASLQPVSFIDTTERKLYLTFDTAMGDSYLPEILEVLHKYRAKASFAVLGSWAEMYPDQVKMLDASGQMIFCHSMEHPLYTAVSEEVIRRDADRAMTLLTDHFTEVHRCIRPPYGAWDERTTTILWQEGLSSVLWSVDAGDWQEQATVQQITDTVLGQIKPGDIVLFQTDCPQTPQALAQILEVLKEMRFETAVLPF